MGTKMNSVAYRKMIDEDLEWLNKQPRTLEREHIKDIIEESINHYYPHLVNNLDIPVVVVPKGTLCDGDNCENMKPVKGTENYFCSECGNHY